MQCNLTDNPFGEILFAHVNVIVSKWGNSNWLVELLKMLINAACHTPQANTTRRVNAAVAFAEIALLTTPLTISIGPDWVA
jgi:hypothetical protein